MQPIGKIARVAEDIYQLKLPVPLPLRFVSVYLISGGEGWTLVDTGYDYPPTYEVWKSGASALGIDLENDVARILVTHFHPDHIGGSRWLQERTGAPVYLLEPEIENARRVWGEGSGAQPFVEALKRHGMPPEIAREAAAGMRSGLDLPELMLPLRAGEKLDLGGLAPRIIPAPGHADHQFMLHDEARGILFAADQVLLEITPNIGLWPESESRPLARYLESLNSLRGLDADLVLPGHGPVFHDLAGRAAEISRHHDERLGEMQAVLDNGAKAPYAVSQMAFRGTLTLFQRCFALAETLAHLDHLELQGRAVRRAGEPVTYQSRQLDVHAQPGL